MLFEHEVAVLHAHSRSQVEKWQNLLRFSSHFILPFPKSQYTYAKTQVDLVEEPGSSKFSICKVMGAGNNFLVPAFIIEGQLEISTIKAPHRRFACIFLGCDVLGESTLRHWVFCRRWSHCEGSFFHLSLFSFARSSLGYLAHLSRGARLKTGVDDH